MRLEAVAHEAQESAANDEGIAEDVEDASQELHPTEHPEPDHYMRPLQRLPKGHLVALAYAEEVLLDGTLAQFDAH